MSFTVTIVLEVRHLSSRREFISGSVYKAMTAPTQTRFHRWGNRLRGQTTKGDPLFSDGIWSEINRHSPDDIHNRGNRTTVLPPKERHPFRRHPMA